MKIFLIFTISFLLALSIKAEPVDQCRSLIKKILFVDAQKLQTDEAIEIALFDGYRNVRKQSCKRCEMFELSLELLNTPDQIISFSINNLMYLRSLYPNQNSFLQQSEFIRFIEPFLKTFIRLTLKHSHLAEKQDLIHKALRLPTQITTATLLATLKISENDSDYLLQIALKNRELKVYIATQIAQKLSEKTRKSLRRALWDVSNLKEKTQLFYLLQNDLTDFF